MSDARGNVVRTAGVLACIASPLGRATGTVAVRGMLKTEPNRKFFELKLLKSLRRRQEKTGDQVAGAT